ncbi:MAG: glutamate--tRNA ligase [Candidatus Magasanikbacteria bacterium RIFOXYD2_FULL_41_14]|uniref:Glutamate--tRNA ligase n=1 Tax=Candidatus Magasanikbacteria bacterium RIFOXYD2_FULL_41_14 TaxID=1798709 RepID=A0A1F6PGE3_9BACT|nr:MAG: glutamate--tRNA ligase [Candidatus Magasanikbacteria bacterium RIFOXYD2_FULL_41_14]
MISTRFAPSPTGFLHVGSLRTALYCYLIAKQNSGKFLLRVEDTDQKRSVEGAIPAVLDALKWAGIEPDEGVVGFENNDVVEKGDCGPYLQSKRLKIYEQHANILLEKGCAYYCFCTPERLAQVRERQEKNHEASGYDGHCRELDINEIKNNLSANVPYVVRLKMPKTGVTEFTDLIKGKVSFKNEFVDDQVLLKTDGFPTYHLAVVVDDHLMAITHVIRGDEWLSSTPKHIYLYECFGWEKPVFAHLPLLLNADKSKLSKRQGDVAVGDYIKKGYLPEALINFVAFLGWNPGDDREIFSLAELAKEFSLEKVNKSGAVFNLEKLDWYNKYYLRQLSNEQVAELVLPFFGDKIKDLRLKIEDFANVIGLEKGRVTTLAELPEAVGFVFNLPDYLADMLIWKKSSPEEAIKILSELKDWLNTKSVQPKNKIDWEKRVGEWIVQKSYSNGVVLWPLRVALSGQEKSPGPYEIAAVLGKDEVLKRLEVALIKLK